MRNLSWNGVERKRRLRKYQRFYVKHRLRHKLFLMLLKGERIFAVCFVEKFYQFFFLLLIHIPLGIKRRWNVIRHISIHVLAVGKLHYLIVLWLIHEIASSNLKVIGYHLHFNLRLHMLLIMVHIALGITIKNWLLDTCDGWLSYAIKYLILLNRDSLKVYRRNIWFLAGWNKSLVQEILLMFQILIFLLLYLHLKKAALFFGRNI